MAPDEPNENDEVFRIDGLAFIIDRQVWARSRPVTVDYKKFGFQIISSAPNAARR